MHTAILYNDKGKSLGKKYYSYRKVSVLPNTVDINGSEYYKLALGDDYNDAYIKASNIDGTKRTLKRNAYVYETSKRRADYTVLRKGSNHHHIWWLIQVQERQALLPGSRRNRNQQTLR